MKTSLETDEPNLEWIVDLDRRERTATRIRVHEYEYIYTPYKVPATRHIPRSQLVGLAVTFFLLGALMCAGLFTHIFSLY